MSQGNANRAQRRQMERDGLMVPPGGVPNLGALGDTPDMPTLGEQRRSAALQLAIQGIGMFENADEFVRAAGCIERFLANTLESEPLESNTLESEHVEDGDSGIIEDSFIFDSSDDD